MSKLLTHLLIFLLLPVAAACMSAQADGFDWIHDYDEALFRAQEQGKPIFAYLETDTCTYCRQMEATTLKDRSLIEDVGDDFIWLKLDAEKDQHGIALRERFRVDSFPGMLVLDAKGREWDRFTGYTPADELRRKLDQATGPNSFRVLLERIDADPSDAQAQFLIAERLRDREQWKEAAQAYADYLRADAGNSLKRADQALYYRAVGLSMSGQVMESLKTLETLEAGYPSSPFMPDSVLFRGQLLQHLERNQEARIAFETYLQRYPEHGYAPQVRDILSKLPGGTALPMARSH
ncbi:MAG TPA: thioredoxin fold domain-containing protein [Acidobacteriota bacterium]|nr:thioredoxin fold domain-containing protein [Acidobacteriota bacterium]